MTPTVKSRLLDLMSEIAQKMDDTRKIARTACATDEEAERYSRRIDEVLEHVANARATVLATTVDRD